MANENLKLPPEIEQFTQKLVADPKSRVFAQLADAYRKAGMTDEAIEIAKKGMEHHPAYATAHLILGRCYLEKQMYALAREEFEATIKNDPQNLVGYKLLAGTYEKQNMFAEAVKFYQMVLDLEPSDTDLAEKVASLKAGQDERPQVAPEPEIGPEPEPVQQAAPVLEIAHKEAEPVPAREEMVPAAEEKPLKPKSEEPAKDDVKVSAAAISFPEVLAETSPATEPVKLTEPKTMPVVESPQMESKPEEEKPTIKGEVSKISQPVPAEIKEEPVKTEAPELKAEEKPAAATVTLAEIYVQQGFYEKAIDVYKELISAEPDNGDYKARMDELLEKAYPEEKPEGTAEEKKKPEPPAKEEPAAPAPVVKTEAVVPGIPVAEPEAKKEPTPEEPVFPLSAAAPVTDIFGGMFDKPEPKVAESKPPAQDDTLTKTFAPPAGAGLLSPKQMFGSAQAGPEEPAKPVIPLPEEKPEPQPAPEPAKETPVDFSALFSDVPKIQEKQSPAGEPAKPEAGAGTDKKAEGENTVSSFQSWLSSLQK
ncbi:tetratricopeptide repeat protein [candidate division TA06 bacterium]|uniref:Tetratricopeptide repeat protein n=1 Tax=candidate division TA06 bacterium TaxID=2250710 RepID=A0A933IC18_UNCT6|nr:tetratricopeptide repeat protein [candidate division TA06 bacterium]